MVQLRTAFSPGSLNECGQVRSTISGPPGCSILVYLTVSQLQGGEGLVNENARWRINVSASLKDFIFTLCLSQSQKISSCVVVVNGFKCPLSHFLLGLSEREFSGPCGRVCRADKQKVFVKSLRCQITLLQFTESVPHCQRQFDVLVKHYKDMFLWPIVCLFPP